MTALTTPAAIDAFRLTLVTKAIGFYLQTGMQVNRAYTPANLRRVATECTGKQYPRSRKGLEQAYVDLGLLLAQVKEELGVA